MNYFLIPKISRNLLDNSVISYFLEKGNNWKPCNWSIIPYILSEEDKTLIKPILNKLPVMPIGIALLTTPANSITATHQDHLPNPPTFDNVTKSTGRITAINIALKNYKNSWVEFYDVEEKNYNDKVFYHDDTAVCLRVDLLHRVNNFNNDENRVVLTFSYAYEHTTLFNILKTSELL